MNEKNLKLLYTSNLRHLRNELGKSVAEMSKELGVSTSTLSSYMSGARTMSLEMATHLYKIYNINLSWFVTGEGEMFLKQQQTNLEEKIQQIVEKILDEREGAMCRR